MQWVERILRLVSPLDGGELATVYRASDPEQAGRIRAVAVLHPNLSNAEAVAVRLLERIDVARGLQHPAHVACEGIFLVGGRPALVMDYIEGKDLERIAKRKALPGPVAAYIGLHVVELLQQAKLRGLVHGLVSPTRIRVDTLGQVRVLGMGAKAGSSVDAEDPLYKEDRSVRRYAPPELMGGLLTSATDVYALGAVLTLLVSGRWPKRPSIHSSGQAVVADGARTVLMHAGASEALAQLVKECMAFRSDFRPTLDEMHAVLREEAIDAAGWRRWVSEQILTVTDSTEIAEPDGPRGGVQMPGESSRVIESLSVANPSVDLADQETTLQEPDARHVESRPSESDSLDDADTLLDEPNSSLDESETLLDEADDDASNQEPSGTGKRGEAHLHASRAESDSKGEMSVPPLLGSLPPPDTDDVSVRPLAIADVHTDDVEQTEWTEDPDTVDELIEDVGGSVDSVLDENADHWDRMLGLDVKADTDIDKDWIRAARGQGEYSQRITTSFMVVFFGVLGAWAMGWLDPLMSEDASGSSVTVPVKNLDPILSREPVPEEEAVPVPDPGTIPEPTPEPEPTPAPEPTPEPEPVAAPQVDAVRTPSRTRRRVETPPSPPQPSTPPVPTPTPQASSAAVEAAPPTPSTAAIRVTGDAHRVQFLDGTRRISGGRLPAGSYTIEVVFREGEATQQQGQITIEPGQSAIVNCKASFYRCSIRGPW